jgi:hypothetical protein
LFLYQHILETLYVLKVMHTVFFHLKGVRVVPYRTDYLKNVIEDMLDFSLKGPDWHFPQLVA